MADKNSERNKAETESGTSRLAAKVMHKADKLKFLVLGILVLLIVVMAGYSYIRRSNAKREAAAENAVFKAQLDLANNPGAGAEEYAKLAKEYAGLPAGARVMIADFARAFNARDFAAAEKAAGDFIKAYPKSTFVPRAQLALGQSQLMLGKAVEAENTFRPLVANRDPMVFAEAKLALAQSLERQAEDVKDQPEEYRNRLERAAEEYADITGQAQSPVQRGFWPQAVTAPADFALVIIRDKLAGYQHPAPLGKQDSAASAVPSSVDAEAIPPPPADPVGAVRSEAEAKAVEAAMQGVESAVQGLQTVPAETPDGELVETPNGAPADEEPKAQEQ